MLEAKVAGVVAWRVKPGDEVITGDVLGEIVDIENIDIPRIPIIARTSGVIFSMRRHKLVRPGQVIIKIAGIDKLPWRLGNLLPI
jgi:predicted deacylase